MKNRMSVFLLLCSSIIWAGEFDELSFGKDESLDIVTWNIEHFPKGNTNTISKVKEIILALDADIIAIQEVEDTAEFSKMVDELDDYEGCYGNYYYVALGYIYKSSLQVNKIEELFYGQWNIFPRPPYLLDISFNGESYYVINNHFKCCGDGTLDKTKDDDEEYRRLRASEQLKTYIDTHLDDKNVIVLGDLNDVLEDDSNSNVFQPFIDDSSHFLFTDWGIAQGNSSDWSYPSWPSHLDHILITNELFDNTDGAKVIKVDDYMRSWSSYESAISDHRPVGISVETNSYTEVDTRYTNSQGLSTIPNPFSTETIIKFHPLESDGILKITNSGGKVVYAGEVEQGQNSVRLYAGNFSNGIYYTTLFTERKTLSSKLIISK